MKMKNLNTLILAGAVMLFSAFTISNSINWKIQESHSIKFAGTDAEGIFKTLNGEVIFDEADLAASSLNFKIDVNSINTGNGMQNKHAVSSKWFDAETYPTINFQSTKITKGAEGYSVTGDLEIHGVKKVVTMPVSFADNTFTTKFSVNRLDYGVGTMKGMSKKVSNEIKLDVTIPVSK